jgi:hypothetical protein
MGDPSSKVAAPLLPHLHLVSAHRYAPVAHLQLEQVFLFLRDAPSVVKSIAPVYWSYVNAPGDGTIQLEWLAQDKTDAYPSDGYVWADPEATYRHEYAGYTIELRVHQVGYIPGHEQVTKHARTRYHFVAKNPALNAQMPDPSLWIVHYHPVDPSRFLNVAQIPMMPHMGQILSQRRWLESLGRLEQEKFMLHDREKWPTVTMPGAPNLQQGVYAANQMGMQMPPNRFQQPQYPQQAGGPPNKRPRTQGPGAHAAPGAVEMVQQAVTIEDEENTSYGDYFDHLTPRDISLARYMQHHRWIEEVFSSPYATSQIVPPDLGLGLMGELKKLTDGILAPPSTDAEKRPAKAEEAKAFTNLKKEQVDEFTQRVEKHLQDGQAELEKMKAEHAEKLRSWKKISAVAQADQKLRLATWAGHTNAVPAFRFEQSDKQTSNQTVEAIQKDVEELLGVKVKKYDDATLVSRGGLRDRQLSTDVTSSGKETQQGARPNGSIEAQSATTALNSTTPGAPTIPPHTSNVPQAQTSAATTISAPSTGLPQMGQQPFGNTNTGLNNNSLNAGTGGMDDLDIPDLDDIDMSMDMGDSGTFDNNAQSSSGLPPATTSLNQQSSSTAQNPSSHAPTNTALERKTVDEQDNFDDLDDGGMIDFDGGMDDSAFGDALHGMDG